MSYYVNGQETLLYIHKDHLGSAVRLTDTEGAVVQSLAYDPFGFTVYSGGVSEPTNQYTGQKKDGSGLYYYGARYYDPELGRFISPDRLLKDGLNRYAYCRNNPIRYTDPTGETTQEEGQRMAEEGQKNMEVTHNSDGTTTYSTSYRDENGNTHNSSFTVTGQGSITDVSSQMAAAPPPGGPPVPVPYGNGIGWKPVAGTGSRPIKWVPEEPVKVPDGKGGQPSASWDDKHNHWDVDDGTGNRNRFDDKGRPLSDDEAHGRQPQPSPQPTPTPTSTQSVVQIPWGEIIIIGVGIPLGVFIVSHVIPPMLAYLALTGDLN